MLHNISVVTYLSSLSDMFYSEARNVNPYSYDFSETLFVVNMNPHERRQLSTSGGFVRRKIFRMLKRNAYLSFRLNCAGLWCKV